MRATRSNRSQSRTFLPGVSCDRRLVICVTKCLPSTGQQKRPKEHRTLIDPRLGDQIPEAVDEQAASCRKTNANIQSASDLFGIDQAE